MARVLVSARRLRSRVGVVAFIAIGLAVSVLGGKETHAVGGPTWWKVDPHEHSSYSGDGRQDLGLLAANDKNLNYNAIFVTDHDRGPSFSISGTNGNYIDYRDVLGGRWTAKTFNSPTTFTNADVSSPVHSGSGSRHLAVTSPSATNMRTAVYATRGPTLRSGDVTLDFWVRPVQISAGSGVDVSVSLGGDATTGQSAYGYSTSDGVAHIAKSTVLVWQLGSARAASNNGTTNVITNALSYTLNTWNHYVINVNTGAVAWTPTGGSTTNSSSSGLSSLTAADAPATDVVLANVVMQASATNGTADAYFDDYTLKSANQNCPAADFATRNAAIGSGVYNGTNQAGQSFKLFAAREMGQTFHANQFNFDFTSASQYYDVFSDSLANDATLCAGTNNPSAPWQFQNHGTDNIPSVQASGYPAQDNHPGVTDSVANVIATLAHGADAVEEMNANDFSTTWDAILQQHRQIMGTWGTDAHEKVGNGGNATYIDAPALTLDDLMRGYFEGRMFGAANNFSGHLVFNLGSSNPSPYPARYPVYVPAVQASANVHLKIDGGLSSGQKVNWYYNSGSGNTTITDTVSGSTYEATKAIPLSGSFTYVRADVRSSTGTLVATTQPIFFEDVTGLTAGVSVHVDSVRGASGCACSRTVTQGITSTSWNSGTKVLSTTLTDQSGSTVGLLGTTASAPTLLRMDGSTITQSANLAAFQAASGDAWFYDSPTQTLYLQDLQSSGTSTILVTLPGGGNQAPTAGPVSLNATSGVSTPWTPVVSDPNGDPLTCSIVSPPSHGSATLPSCSGGTYTSTGGYTGPDSFTYKANDGLLDSPTATVTVTVSSGGGGGSIALVQQKVASGNTATLPATLNQASGAGHALVAMVALAAGSSASVLSVTDSASGTWTKGPVGFLSGTNSRVEIWYRLNASSVTGVTATLSAAKSAAVNVTEWSGVATTSAFDVSKSGSAATATTVSTPSPFTTTNATDLVLGAVNYPAGVSSTLVSGSFTGLTDFSFSSSVHGRAAYDVSSAVGSFQASWTLAGASGGNGGAILALKAAGGGGGNQAPTAGPVSVSAASGVSKPWTPVVSDPNGDPLTCSIVSPPTHGTATLPSCSGGTYTSTGGYTGPDSFTYKANDGLLDSPTATVTVTVSSGNQAPTAGPVSVNATSGVSTPWTPVVSDPNGDPLTCLIVSPPSHGSATLPSCSGGTYTSTGGYTGPDSFTYKANDGLLDSPAATVTVNVTSGGGGGSIALVQQKVASGTAATLPATLTSPSTAGHALVAVIALAAGSSASVLSVTDSASGTWTKGTVGFQNGVNTRVEIWYRLNASSVTSVTVTLSAAKSAAVNVTEWSGVAASAADDGSVGGSGATSTSVATPLLGTTNATDLVIGAINYPAAATSTLTSGSFTSLSDLNATTSVHGRAAYQVTTVTANYQTTWTLSVASGGNGSAILALKAA